MGLLSLLSLLLLVTFALGAPPQKPGSGQKKPSTPSAGKTGGANPTQLDKDTQIIYQLRDLITEDPKKKTEKWIGLDVCGWEGITCAKTPLGFTAVAAIVFNDFGFGGPHLTPGQILSNLPYVTVFHARNNKFVDTIPADLSHLPYLYELDLSFNLLHGAFPQGVLSAKLLTYVDISNNNFGGPIPREIFSMDLDVLYLDHNSFTGSISSDLGTLVAIYVSLSDNKLEGPIPGTLNKNLQRIFFQHNALSGSLPEVANLVHVEVMDFSENRLSGSIPASYANLPTVAGLNFSSNQLTGSLPEFHTPKLELFDAANNQLSGTVPESLCASPKIFGIDLKNNNLVGELGPACLKIYNDKKKYIDVHGNCITNVAGQKPGCGLHGGQDEATHAQPKGSGTQKTKQS